MTASKKINILLADDHQMVLDGLQAIIDFADDIEIAARANNGREVLEFLRENRDLIDIAVMDIEMPEMDGINTTKAIRERYPNIKILILSMHDTEGFVTQMIQAGVSGYILKNKGSEELIQAIRTLYRGEEYFSQSVTKILVDSIRGKSSSKSSRLKLTKREVEVLKLIGQGLTTPEISKKLFIAHSTVDTHRRNLIDKLGVANSRGLVRYAVENGYA